MNKFKFFAIVLIITLIFSIFFIIFQKKYFVKNSNLQNEKVFILQDEKDLITGDSFSSKELGNYESGQNPAKFKILDVDYENQILIK